MSNTIKYIGIVIGGGVFLIICFFVFFIWLLGYEILGASNIEYYRAKFLLTATVEVDGIVKSGEGIYEISYNRRTHGGGQGLQISPINGVKGSLPVIDLGDGSYLVFSFYTFSDRRHIPQDSFMKRGLCSFSTIRHAPTSVMINRNNSKRDNKINFREKINLLQSIDFGKKINFQNYSLPVYHARKDIPYNKKNNFLFCDLGTMLGSNFKPISLTIQKTNLENKVNDHLPQWLIKSLGKNFQRIEFK